MNKKLPGFTLIELLFALALTGLVLVMGSGTFRVFVSFFNRFDEQTAQSYNSMIFKDRLHKDFDQASFMEVHQKSTSHTELLLYSLSGDIRFSYQFEDSWVLRRETIRAQDTFFIKTEISPFASGNGISLRDKDLKLEYTFQLKKRAQANREELISIHRK